MAKSNNPFAEFDVTKMMVAFDPTKMMVAFDPNKIASQYKLPEIDVNSLVDYQRKNVEALTAANKMALEGVQAVAKRQVGILQETVATATEAMEALGKSGSPQDAAAKQADLVKQAFEKTIANMRELTELTVKSNTEATETINNRIAEGLEEIKAQALKMN